VSIPIRVCGVSIGGHASFMKVVSSESSFLCQCRPLLSGAESVRCREKEGGQGAAGERVNVYTETHSISAFTDTTI
jgi:hypothetical protein